jgi:hypothetical protein
VVFLPAWGQELHGMSFDLSRLGIAVALAVPLPVGTKMVVRRFGDDGSRPLYVTVVCCTPRKTGYLHGCLLSVPLVSEQLAAWLS